MLRFQSRDLTNQFISTSYQDVVQHLVTGSQEYLLDGYGEVILQIDSGSGNVLTASYAVTSSITVQLFTTNSLFSVSSSWASSSISSSFSQTASYALSSNATTLFTASTYQITSSWSNNSISASHANIADVALNAGTTLFTGSTYQITSSWAQNSISSSYAVTASFVDVDGFNNLIVPLQFTYKNSTSAADPGKGNFRYNSLTSGSITEIYIDQFTNGGLDISGIIDSLKSGSYRLYVQQKNDATKASLFAVSSVVTDNTGWFTIPVVHLTSAENGLPKNGQDCAFYIINRTTIVPGDTYPVTSSWSNDSLRSLASISASWASQSFSAVSSSWASSSISSSYSLTASFALNAGSSGGTSLTTGSTYPITASWAINAVTSSYLIYPSSLKTAGNNATTPLIFQTSSVNNSIFINYTLNDGANFRAGNVVVLYNTSSVNLAETTTTDIGDSSGLSIIANINNTFVTVSAVNGTGTNFTIKYHYDNL